MKPHTPRIELLLAEQRGWRKGFAAASKIWREAMRKALKKG